MRRIINIYEGDVSYLQTDAVTWYPESNHVTAVGFLQSDFSIVSVSDLATGKIINSHIKNLESRWLDVAPDKRIVALNTPLKGNALRFTIKDIDAANILGKRRIYLIVETNE